MKRNHDSPMSQPLSLFLISLSMPETSTLLSTTGKAPTMRELLSNSATTNELIMESQE